MSSSKGQRPDLDITADAGSQESGPASGDERAVAYAQTVAGDTPAKGAVTDEVPVNETLGRYEIIRVLGRGGMGVVYAARDPDLDRTVAIKVLKDGEAGKTEGARARLLREARAMARLNHPNVITVHEVGTAGETDFVAMELIEGGTLTSWRAEASRGWREIVKLFLGAGAGLAAAHRAGLIHRDFKPDNVLVDASGRVVVTDFGLARPPRPEPEAASLEDTAAPDDSQNSSLEALTQAGAIAGTPAYMAPEQYAGREADERTDQFAFCVALYESLYGKRPFRGDTLDTLREQVESGAVEVPLGRASGVPSRVRRALLRGLSPKRSDRHPSLEALLGELKKALARRRRQAITLGAAAALGAGAFAMLLGDGSHESSMCDPSAHLAGVWDGETEEALSAALARDPSADLAIATFTSYATEWGESYESVCRGAYEREDIAEEDFLLARRSGTSTRSCRGSARRSTPARNKTKRT